MSDRIRKKIGLCSTIRGEYLDRLLKIVFRVVLSLFEVLA